MIYFLCFIAGAASMLGLLLWFASTGGVMKGFPGMGRGC